VIATKTVGPAEPSPIERRQPEALLNVRQAANATGLKYWLLLRAVKNGDIPHYRFGKGQRRVRLSDIEAVIQASRSQPPRRAHGATRR